MEFDTNHTAFKRLLENSSSQPATGIQAKFWNLLDNNPQNLPTIQILPNHGQERHCYSGGL